MTGLAVARKRNILLRYQIVDILLIKRLPKSVAMGRLTPLRMYVSVTFCTAFSGDEFLALDELSVIGRRV